MPIKSLPKYMMSPGETSTIGQRLVILVTKPAETDSHLKEMTDHLQTGVDTMDNAMNSGTDLSLSADVRLLDDTRDETLKQFGGFLRGVMNHYIPEKASAATDIYNILSRHDFGAKKSGYAEQSSVVNSLLMELENEKTKELVSICEIQPFIDRLRNNQTAFEQAVMDRIDDTGEKNQPPLNTLIIPVRADINGILVHIENRERLYPEKYATLVAEINAMITEIASTVRARKTRKEVKEENTPATVS